jgi:hypothetical protein
MFKRIMWMITLTKEQGKFKGVSPFKAITIVTSTVMVDVMYYCIPRKGMWANVHNSNTFLKVFLWAKKNCPTLY